MAFPFHSGRSGENYHGCKGVFFHVKAGYFYFSAEIRLQIFLCTFLGPVFKGLGSPTARVTLARRLKDTPVYKQNLQVG